MRIQNTRSLYCVARRFYVAYRSSAHISCVPLSWVARHSTSSPIHGIRLSSLTRQHLLVAAVAPDANRTAARGRDRSQPEPHISDEPSLLSRDSRLERRSRLPPPPASCVSRSRTAEDDATDDDVTGEAVQPLVQPPPATVALLVEAHVEAPLPPTGASTLALAPAFGVPAALLWLPTSLRAPPPAVPPL
jgi:hypothetical protein